jgi:hypothetical protein
MPTLSLIEQTALDTLVISQLAEIRKRESALQKRLCSLSLCIGTEDQMQFDEELLQLQQRTDRLSRLVNAMSGYSSQFV